MKKLLSMPNGSRIILLVYIIISVGLVFSASKFYLNRKDELAKKIENELKTTAELKASEISSWIAERVADVTVLAHGYNLNIRLFTYLDRKNNDDYSNILEKISAAKKNYHYEDVFILDKDNNVLISTNNKIKNLSYSTKKILSDGYKESENAFFKVYWCDEYKKVMLDFAAPLFSDNNKANLIGFIVLRSNPESYLFPLINRWPTLSKTAETVIVREEADTVIFINNVRHLANSALKIKIPLTNKNVVAVKGIKGEYGILEGVDYRNRNVLAYASPINNTPWVMIAKIDIDEAYYSIKFESRVYAVLISILVLFLATTLFLVRNAYQKSYFKKLYDSEIERKALAHHYEFLIKNANDIIILADNTDKIININDAAIKAYQYKREDLLNTPLNKIGEFLLNSKNNTKSLSSKIYESVNFRADGSTFPVEINEQFLEIEGKKYHQAVIRDITDRKAVEKALIESQTRLKDIIEQSQTVIWEVNEKGLYTYVSPISEIVWGYKPEELINKKHFYDLHPIDGREEFIANTMHVFAKKDNFKNFINKIEKPNGEIIWVTTNGIALIDDKNNLLGYRGADNDVTEQKLAEQALYKSETLHKLFFDNNPIPMWVYDLETFKFLNVNNTACEKYGYSKGEFLNLTIFDIRPESENERLKLNLNTIIESSIQQSTEWKHKLKNGDIINVDIHSHSIDVNDRKARLVAAYDITEKVKARQELLKSEERFRNTLDNMMEGCQIISFDYKYLYLNKVAIKQSGLSKEELIGNTMIEKYPGIENTLMFKNLEKCMIERTPIIMENKFDYGNGKFSWFELKMEPVSEGVFMLSTDITEEKNALIALEESEKRFESLVNTQTSYIIRTNLEGKYTFCNNKFVEDFGWLHKNKVLGEYSLTSIMEYDHKKTISTVERCIANPGTTFKIELDKPASNGGVRTTLWEFVCLTSESNKLTEIQCVGLDISDRKKAETKLLESEQKLKFAQELAKMGSWRIDLSNYQLTVSENYKKLIEIDNENIDITFNYFINRIHPDDANLMNPDIYNFSPESPPVVFDFRMIMADKSIRWFQNSMVGEFSKGKLIALNGTNIDITEKKNREEEIRLQNEKLNVILNSLPDKLFVHDSKGNFLEAYTTSSDGFIVPIEKFIGKNFKDIFPNDIAELNLKYLQKCLETKEMITHEFSTDYKGTYTHFEVRAVPFMKDKVIRFVRDITEKKKIEQDIRDLNASLENKIEERTIQLKKANEELVKAKEEAELANKAKSTFLATMSHEIRTPMNAVLGYADLLETLITDKTQRDYVKSIKSSGKSLLTIINDVLDLSKIEAGKLELEFQFVKSNSFFTEFESIFALKMKQKGIHFELNIDPKTPVALYIDEARIRQILLNLIGNAVKFTDKGFVRLAVYTENQKTVEFSKDHKENFVDLFMVVTDSGIGIPEELKQNIFEEFTQAEGLNRQGTGLGLPITKRLTEMMEGTISFTSKLDKGSSFSVKIPDVQYRNDTQDISSSLQINPENIIFKDSTILVIDDVEMNRKYLQDVLKATNLKVIETSSAEEGIEIIAKKIPDLIICDIRMPGMDGFAFMGHVRKQKELNKIPVIAYSASVMKEQKKRIFESGFNGLLPKPLLIAELYNEICKYLPYESIEPTLTNLIKEEINFEEVLNIKELILVIDQNLYPKWETFKNRQPIADIKEFGKTIIETGIKYNAKGLVQFGEDMVAAATNFNVDGILLLINKFPEIVKIIKSIDK